MHLIHYKVHSSNQFFRVLPGHFTNRFGERFGGDSNEVFQQFVVATNNEISLWVMNKSYERWCVARQNVYGMIRSIESFSGPPGGMYLKLWNLLKMTIK